MIDIKQLSSYKSAFSLLRGFVALVFLGSMGVVGLSMYWVVHTIQKERESLWLIAPNGQAYYAQVACGVNHPSRVYEYESHMRLFYQLFFSYDGNNYASNIERGLVLIGKSGEELYNFYHDHRVYEKLVKNNVRVQAAVDSVFIDMSVVPAAGVVYGKQCIEKQGKTVFQKLNASFKLRDMARSRSNPHGAMIEDFVIFDNSIVKKM